MKDKDTLYSRWLSGKLSSSEIQSLKASGEWEELEAIINATQQLGLPKMDLDTSYGQFKQKVKAPVGKVRKLSVFRIGAAAAVLALAMGLFFWWQGRQEEVYAASKTNVEARLTDGSRVVVNDGSTIRYRKVGWLKNRVVQLIGEAFFEVSPGREFLVQTDGGLVTVLGTEFNVRHWGRNLQVECYTGKVRVELGGQTKELTAGKQVNLIIGKDAEVTDIDHKTPLWQKGRSVFQLEDVNTVLEEIGRQYNIVVEAPKFNRNFVGAFEHNNLTLALDNVCKPMGLRYEISEDGKKVNINR